MNQAKDYHNDSKLNKTKLNKHAERCNAAVLDGVFGKRRLLCVAGSMDVVLAKVQCNKDRNFLPYVFDNGQILLELLETLGLFLASFAAVGVVVVAAAFATAV